VETRSFHYNIYLRNLLFAQVVLVLIHNFFLTFYEHLNPLAPVEEEEGEEEEGDEEVLSSVEAYKKSMKKKFQIKDENLNVSGTGTRGNLIRVFVKGDKA
jgi:hypothetical protein